MSIRGLVILISLFVLNSNGWAQPIKDGPPPAWVTATQKPDPIPKVEPLSPYGNPRSYLALGKRYYTLPSAKGYHEQGDASWYGTKFQGRHTSTGERYNMFEMTAAHKSLPIPCYVQVTNLENNKKIIVRVNDRGPFHKGRIIDLSYAAAKKLDMLEKGTAHVQVDVIEPASEENEPYDDGLNEHNLFLQVGMFREETNADHFADKIEEVIDNPIVIRELNINHSSFYRVKIGPLLDAMEGEILKKELKKMGVSDAVLITV